MSERTRNRLDVFISHATENKSAANAACAVLEQRRIRCWIAPRDVIPGTKWGDAIVEGIQSCRVMVLIFSRDANQSDYVKNEITLAIDHALPILTFRLEDVQPQGGLKLSLCNSHWLDAFNPPMEAKLKQLAESVEALLGLKEPQRDVSPALPMPFAESTAQPRWPFARLAASVVISAVIVGLAVFMRPAFGPPSTTNAETSSSQVSNPIVAPPSPIAETPPNSTPTSLEKAVEPMSAPAVAEQAVDEPAVRRYRVLRYSEAFPSAGSKNGSEYLEAMEIGILEDTSKIDRRYKLRFENRRRTLWVPIENVAAIEPKTP